MSTPVLERNELPGMMNSEVRACDYCDQPASHVAHIFCGCVELYCVEHLSELIFLLADLIGWQLECPGVHNRSVVLTKVSDFVKETRRL